MDMPISKSNKCIQFKKRVNQSLGKERNAFTSVYYLPFILHVSSYAMKERQGMREFWTGGNE